MVIDKHQYLQLLFDGQSLAKYLIYVLGHCERYANSSFKGLWRVLISVLTYHERHLDLETNYKIIKNCFCTIPINEFILRQSIEQMKQLHLTQTINHPNVKHFLEKIYGNAFIKKRPQLQQSIADILAQKH